MSQARVPAGHGRRRIASREIALSAPDTDVKLGLDMGTQAWDLLARQVDAFLAEWRSGQSPPNLAAFLPGEPAALRQMVLVELIKVDLEHRWQEQRFPKLIEDYVAEFPELGSIGPDGEGLDIPCDLIYEEYHVRRRLQPGVFDPLETIVNADDYFKRFPRQAAQLARLLGVEQRDVSTILWSGEKAHEIDVGQRVDDFDLLTRLGKGAFASVYLARQRSMQRLVALKVSGDKGAEPQTLAQLNHPNIVRVYDTRSLPERKLRLLYMQYVPGGTLLSVLEHLRKAPAGSLTGMTFLEAIDDALIERGEQPQFQSSVRRKLEHASWPQVVCWLGARLAGALAYAHTQGVLHRDIKPANVLVDADGNPKLADFNISFSSKIEGATPAAYFGGSLAYMSPEQLEACDPAHSRQPDELDGRSDMFSLGVMLWELLAGSRPFTDEAVSGTWSTTLGQMITRRQAGVPDAARAQLPASCPAGLEQVLLKCLAADRDARFATAAEASRQLDLCLQPRAQKMLHEPEVGWRDLPRRWPRAAIIVAGLAPNVAMSGLNIAYNWYIVVRNLPPETQALFTNQQLTVINLVAYLTGVGLFFYVNWGVARTVSWLSSRRPVAAGEFARLRERCLKMGDYSARVCAGLWAVSGLIFPTWMHLAGGVNAHLTVEDYVKFITSQVLCGLMAATLTFFCVTFLAVRVYYPRLVQHQTPAADEAGQLVTLSRRVSAYFVGAVAVPFISILPVTFVETGRIAVAVLGVFGLLTSLLSFLLMSAIREDLSALATVVNPAGESLAGVSDSGDAFWTGSRR